MGANDILAKPFSENDFLGKINQLLARWRSRPDGRSSCRAGEQLTRTTLRESSKKIDRERRSEESHGESERRSRQLLAASSQCDAAEEAEAHATGNFEPRQKLQDSLSDWRRACVRDEAGNDAVPTPAAPNPFHLPRAATRRGEGKTHSPSRSLPSSCTAMEKRNRRWHTLRSVVCWRRSHPAAWPRVEGGIAGCRISEESSRQEDSAALSDNQESSRCSSTRRSGGAAHPQQHHPHTTSAKSRLDYIAMSTSRKT